MGIVLGGALATAGAIMGVYAIGSAYLASELGVKIFTIAGAILFPAGTALIYVSAALMATTSTSLGAALTIPLAGLCFALPFIPILPGLLGALPGASIGITSYFGLQNLETGEVPPSSN